MESVGPRARAHENARPIASAVPTYNLATEAASFAWTKWQVCVYVGLTVGDVPLLRDSLGDLRVHGVLSYGGECAFWLWSAPSVTFDK